MAILATCPYCNEGKVRAPDKAVGLIATCPKCLSCFTLVPSDGAQKPYAESKSPSRTAGAPLAALPPEAGQILPRAAITLDIPTPPPELAAPATKRGPLKAKTSAPAGSATARREPRTALGLALIAITLAGAGLAASQAPFGRIAATALSALGLAGAVGNVILANRKPLWPIVAAIMNAGVLVILLAFPAWLGLGPWWPHKIDDDSNQIKAVAFGRGEAAPMQNDWLDASKAAWQHGDVRVKIMSAVIAPIEWDGPQEQKKRTLERYLQIRVRITNVGITRKLEYRSWNDESGSDVQISELRDDTGRLVARRAIEGGWLIPGRTHGSDGLFPGKSTDDVFVYELPRPSFELLRWQLSEAAFGGSGQIHLMIPKSMIEYR